MYFVLASLLLTATANEDLSLKYGAVSLDEVAGADCSAYVQLLQTRTPESLPRQSSSVRTATAQTAKLEGRGGADIRHADAMLPLRRAKAPTSSTSNGYPGSLLSIDDVDNGAPNLMRMAANKTGNSTSGSNSSPSSNKTSTNSSTATISRIISKISDTIGKITDVSSGSSNSSNDVSSNVSSKGNSDSNNNAANNATNNNATSDSNNNNASNTNNNSGSSSTENKTLASQLAFNEHSKVSQSAAFAMNNNNSSNINSNNNSNSDNSNNNNSNNNSNNNNSSSSRSQLLLGEVSQSGSPSAAFSEAALSGPKTPTFGDYLKAVAAIAAETTASVGEDPGSVNVTSEDQDQEETVGTSAALGATLGVVVGAAIGVN